MNPQLPEGFFAKILFVLMNHFRWLKEVLSNNGIASSKRTVMFISAMCLCACLVALTGTIMYVLIKNPKDHKLDGNIVLLYTALTVPIAGLAGTVYVGKKEILAVPTAPTPPTPPKPVITNTTSGPQC
ncbi:MAG: hypothetical protein JHC33_07155 [Ignisphaera sp.]|nr:hypothetical protein [Ignisphaera sp.]